MSLALDVVRTTTFDRAKGWSDLNPEERRRRAVLAVRDQDADTLWALTEAYLTCTDPAAPRSAHAPSRPTAGRSTAT